MLNKTAGVLFAVLIFLISPVQAQILTYSESLPYEPRKAEDYQTKKARKSKKSKIEVIAPVPQPASFGVSKTITIPVSVFDKNGQFVTGLTKSDFGVFIDDRETAVSSLEIPNQPVNVVVLLDTSPSTFNVEEIGKHATALVNTLPFNANVIVAQFNESITVLSPTTVNRDDTLKGIRKAKMGDGTSLYSVLQTLFRRNFSQTIPGRNVLLLLTDGVDTTSTDADYASTLTEAEKSNITVFPVYFDTLNIRSKGNSRFNGILTPEILRQLNIPNLMTHKENKREYEIGKFFLTDLSHLSGGREISVKDIRALKTGLGDELKLRYHLSFESPGNTTSGQRRSVRVRVNRPNLNVKTRGSYIEGQNLTEASRSLSNHANCPVYQDALMSINLRE